MASCPESSTVKVASPEPTPQNLMCFAGRSPKALHTATARYASCDVSQQTVGAE